MKFNINIFFFKNKSLNFILKKKNIILGCLTCYSTYYLDNSN